MTIPQNPKLSDVISEFGSGGSPKNLGAYTRGGAYVPDTSPNSAISTSASGLRLSQFAGAVAYTPMQAAAGASPASGSCFFPAAPAAQVCQVLTTLDVTVNGGTPPYTYAWSVVGTSGSVGNPTLSSASAHQPNATIPVNDTGLSRGTATFKVEVTDATLATVSDTIIVSAEGGSLGGGL